MVEVRTSKPSQPPPLWEHYSLYRPPERVDLSKSIESSVVNRYRAVKALGKALEQVMTLNDGTRIRRLLEIASVQAEIGEDSSVVLEGAIAIIKKDRHLSGSNYAHAARIAAFTGDFDRAFELTELASNERYFGHLESWPYTATARVLKGKGIDPAIYLDKAAQAQEDHLGHRDSFSSLKASSLAQFAVEIAEYGRDPDPWLRRARDILEKSGQDESWAYYSLADAYAHFGKFDEAKELAEKVKVEEGHHPSRQDALVRVAYRQFEHGLIEEAVQTATEANSPRAISDLLLKKAYQQAKEKKDPDQALKGAIEAAGQIKPQYPAIQDSTECELALAYSRAGRIKAIAGGDPKDMFDNASNMVTSVKDPEQKVDAYKHIAIDLFYAGKDVHEILNLALETESREQSPAMLQDILEAALECGYYEYVDVVMQRLEICLNKYDKNSKVFDHTWSQTIDDWKAIFLTMQTKVFGERSMTRQEISGLPKSEVLKIIASGHPKAIAALAYLRH